ncbi:MAG: copper amine oxidase N-terminal domain-containing protein [Bacillota bacterium]
MIAILATLALLATLLVPMATPAGAATGYYALTVPNVDDDGYYELGTVIAEIPADAIKNGSVVIFGLPSGFKFIDDKTNAPSVTADTYTFAGDTDGLLKISAPQRVEGTDNSLYTGSGNEFVAKLLDDNQIQVTIQNYDPADGDKAFLKIEMEAYVDDGYSGDIELVADAPSTSGFPSGSVVVGKVTGGAAEISVIDKDTSNSDFTVKLRVKENRAGALKAEAETIKLTLPDGFKWKGSDGALTESTIWGQDLDLTIDYEDEEASINLATKSTQATCFEITLNFEVADETEAELGDVKCEVAGESDLTPDEIVVGTYGDYGATIKVDGDVPEVFAGKTNQEIAEIVIKEGMKESLINNRTVLLTLPANARWNEATLKDTSASKGIYLDFVGLTGSDNRTAKFVVSGGSSSGAAELKIKDVEISLEAGKVGDIVVTVSGSAGLSGELVVAKAVAPVKIAAASKPEVQIGKSGQVAGDLTITEVKKGSLKKDQVLALKLPEGVAFATVPTVEVVEGDVKIDKNSVARADSDFTKDNKLIMTIDNDSDTPSTIKISGIKYVLDRTVPEGPIYVAVVGGAVVETSNIWLNSKAAAVAANAVCVTPAPGEQHATVVFTINDTSYTVNGIEQTMDVAPYIKDGRTFVPVRYVAQALGVTPENILYADGKVTLIKGDKVVQLTIGSNVMVINGVGIAMDVPAEIKDGRTMLPFRWVAQALGAKVDWDEANQTVTMEL